MVGLKSNTRKVVTVYVTAVSLCIAAIVLLPVVIPAIMARHPDLYRENIRRRLEQGQMEAAVRIARQASESRSFDPEAKYIYAGLLFEGGKPGPAVAQLDDLFNIRSSLGPEYVPTQKPYFYPNARLLLGGFHQEENRLSEAIVNYELVRAFGQAVDKSWRLRLYAAYSEFGAWARALEYGQPAPVVLGRSSPEAMLEIARICAGRRQWHFCRMAAEAFLNYERGHPEANLLLGYALLAEARPADAVRSLPKAVELGQPDAPFFAGIAMERLGRLAEAEQFFLRSRSDSLYQPFSLAKGIELMRERLTGTVSLSEREALVRALKTYEDEMDGLLSRQLPIPAPSVSAGQDIVPVGFALSQGHFDTDGVCPLLIGWSVGTLFENRRGHGFALEIESLDRMFLAYGNRILELRMVENLVPFGSLEQLAPDMPSIPGWPELYCLPREYNPRSILSSVPGGTGRTLRLTSNGADELCRMATMPLPVKDDRFYLFAVRCKSEDAKFHVGWKWFDEGEKKVAEHNFINQRFIKEWEWHAEYAQRPVGATYVRFDLGIYRDRGSALFDNMICVPLDPPSRFRLKRIGFLTKAVHTREQMEFNRFWDRAVTVRKAPER